MVQNRPLFTTEVTERKQEVDYYLSNGININDRGWRWMTRRIVRYLSIAKSLDIENLWQPS